jgi:putative endonuclease
MSGRAQVRSRLHAPSVRLHFAPAFPPKAGRRRSSSPKASASLARRWKSPVGEIDIVARRRSLLLFVEVKAREKLDDAAWSVTDRQRLRIVAAAEAWLARYPDPRIRDIRFDAMLVAPGRIPRHIPSAFDASS